MKQQIEPELESGHRAELKPEPDWAYRIIELVHDNRFLPLFKDPFKLLKAAGLELGLKVVEVGCGPGFFTIPASEIVGKKGIVYAVDIHPLAIKRIAEKIAENGITNVVPIQTSASNLNLPNASIDLAFIFGLHHVAGGLKGVIREMHRILKPGGILSMEGTGNSGKKSIDSMSAQGFGFLEKKGKILKFRKTGEESFHE